MSLSTIGKADNDISDRVDDGELSDGMVAISLQQQDGSATGNHVSIGDDAPRDKKMDAVSGSTGNDEEAVLAKNNVEPPSHPTPTLNGSHHEMPVNGSAEQLAEKTEISSSTAAHTNSVSNDVRNGETAATKTDLVTDDAAAANTFTTIHTFTAAAATTETTTTTAAAATATSPSKTSASSSKRENAPIVRNIAHTATTTIATSVTQGALATSASSGDLGFGSRKGWLLRLFQSDFFNPWIAVSYLFKYPDVGIQFYLCERLREADPASIQFLLPQLCHILVCSPCESSPLENFMMEFCQSSLHSSIFALWYLENYLNDFRPDKDPQPYLRCARILQQIQSAVFREHMPSLNNVYLCCSTEGSTALANRRSEHGSTPVTPILANSTMGSTATFAPISSANSNTAGSQAEPRRTSANTSVMGLLTSSNTSLPNIRPTLVGFGCALAAFGHPIAMQVMRPLLLMEACRTSHVSGSGLTDPPLIRRTSAPSNPNISSNATNGHLQHEQHSADALNRHTGTHHRHHNTGENHHNHMGNNSHRHGQQGSDQALPPSTLLSSSVPSLEELHKGQAFSQRNYIMKAARQVASIVTSVATSKSEARNAASRLSDSNATKKTGEEASSNNMINNSNASTLNVLSASQPTSPPPSTRSQPSSSSITALPIIPLFYHSEMQFVMSLIDISNRLCLVPKEGRVKALQAELNLINHNLPALLCLPLWCPSMGKSVAAAAAAAAASAAAKDDEQRALSPKGSCHHRMLRISPNDAVVLNSAERVPYVVYVEVLESVSESEFYRLVAEHHDQAFQPDAPSATTADGGFGSTPLTTPTKIIATTFYHGNGHSSDEDFEDSKSVMDLPLEHHIRDLVGHDEGLPGQGMKGFSEKDSGSGVHIGAGSAADGANSSIMVMGQQSYKYGGESTTMMGGAHELADPVAKGGSKKTTQPGQAQREAGHAHSAAKNSEAAAVDDFSERMRTAAIMLAQLARQASSPSAPSSVAMTSAATPVNLASINLIKAKIIQEMEALEKNRLLDALRSGIGHRSRHGTLIDAISLNDDDKDAVGSAESGDTRAAAAVDENGAAAVGSAVEGWASRESLPVLNQRPISSKDDPSAAVFSEMWEQKRARIRAESPFGKLPGWNLLSVIVKAGADMRQEELASQLIYEMCEIWKEAGLPLWMYYFRILVASCNGGLVETVKNAISVHSIKKNAYMGRMNQPGFVFTLRDHFIRTFGSPDSEPFIQARNNFVHSLAGYSLMTYILQLKDRHNGNILVDNQGHLIHIDFGFMLSNSPGYVGFESAPFKLSPEYIELMGGLESEHFARFKELLLHGFMALRKHADRLILLAEMVQRNSRLPCFYTGQSAIMQLRSRFHLSMTEAQIIQLVERLVTSSAYNVFTKLYDTFQYYSNGIL